MSAPAQVARRRRPTAVRRRSRLGRRSRRLLSLGHSAAALAWLGVDMVLAVLTVTGLISTDPYRIAASYVAIGVFAVPLLLVLGLATLMTGIVLSVGAGWGLLRWWWVVAKLAINVVLTALVLVLLRPRVSAAAVEALRPDASLVERLGGIRIDLLFPALVSGAALVVAALLVTVKPWGRTPLGRTT